MGDARDAALSRTILNQTIPDARLSGAANLLIMPNLDANIAFNALKVVSGEDRQSHLAWHRRAGAHLDANQHGAPILNMTAAAVDAAVQR
jgi:malate dehydrogenase (oxaloacetate-decarboxylating)(NADP+)